MIEISQDGYDGILGLIYIYKNGVKNEWKGVKTNGGNGQEILHIL